MPGFASSPKPMTGRRIRTPVGHRYLEALQQRANSDYNIPAPPLSTPHGQDEDAERNGEAGEAGEAGEGAGEGLDLLVLGMTSGTQVDDIDLALCRFRQAHPEATLAVSVVAYDTVVMPSRMPMRTRTEIFSLLQQDACPPSLLSQLDIDLAQCFASAIHLFAKAHSFPVDDVSLIGSGGLLGALNGRPPQGQHRSHICLGDASVVAARTGVTCVSGFRGAEQAVGRQGAPLLGWLDGLLTHGVGRLQVVVSVAGIATVTLVPAEGGGGGGGPDGGEGGGGIDALYDWDVGPGTVLVEEALRLFGFDPKTSPPSSSAPPSAAEEEAGMWATIPPELANGVPHLQLIESMLATTPYLHLRPPKSTALETFSHTLASHLIQQCVNVYGLDVADTIATLAHLTGASVVHQLLAFGPGIAVLNSPNTDIVIDGLVALELDGSDGDGDGGGEPGLRGFGAGSGSGSEREREGDRPASLADRLIARSLPALLAATFPLARLQSFESRTGLPPGVKKGVGFAMLAMEAVLGRAVTVPANADVRRPNTVTGRIAPGVGWRGLMEQAVLFGGNNGKKRKRERGWEGLPEVRDLRVVGVEGKLRGTLSLARGEGMV